jgi:hypothetical protein
VYTSQQLQQLQQQQQYSTAAYSKTSYAGDQRTTSPLEEEDRPGSRLKQNIDELDTLLYDLNNARLAPNSLFGQGLKFSGSFIFR